MIPVLRERGHTVRITRDVNEAAGRLLDWSPDVLLSGTGTARTLSGPARQSGVAMIDGSRAGDDPDGLVDEIEAAQPRLQRRARKRLQQVRQKSGEPLSLLEESDLVDMTLQRIEFLTPVYQPMLLISQVHRSGGSLLSQLFDAHPQCHAFPHELHIGPAKEVWPRLDPAADPATWFDQLSDRRSVKNFIHGYSKGVRNRPSEEEELFPFLLAPSVLRAIFEHLARTRPMRTERDLLDCYMSAYFNAWLDYANMSGQKRWVVAFAARLAMNAESRAAFHETYPDGRLISIIRRPGSWYASAARYRPEAYSDPAKALPVWEASARAILESVSENPDTIVLTFEKLLGDTKATMRRLARAVGLRYGKSMMDPTFNGWPIHANSSFPVERAGLLTEPLERERELADEAGREAAKREALYAEVASLAL